MVRDHAGIRRRRWDAAPGDLGATDHALRGHRRRGGRGAALAALQARSDDGAGAGGWRTAAGLDARRPPTRLGQHALRQQVRDLVAVQFEDAAAHLFPVLRCPRMSSPRSIRNLAAQAGITPEEALALLQAAGLPQRLASQSVGRSDLLRAQVILQLATQSSPEVPAASVQTESPKIVEQAESGTTTKKAAPSTPSVPYELPTVGSRSRDIRYLDAEQIERIHLALEREFASSGDPISPSGPRENGELLASAASRPQTNAAGYFKYPTMEMAGAALLHSLVHNHPFYDGNKRAAAVSLVIFLDNNGYTILCEENELADLVLNVTRHEIIAIDDLKGFRRDDDEVVAIAEWINSKKHKLEVYRRNMKWRELKTLLTSYGCNFENRRGNKIKIDRVDKATGKAYVCQFGARNLGDEIDRKSITYIRKRLNLDEAHGFDSELFHSGKKPIADFIMKYRYTLDRLAEYDRTHG